MASLESSPITAARPETPPGTDIEPINTIPDPRTPTTQPRMRSSERPSSRHGASDQADEIAAMTNKLISLANTSTSLENALQACRYDLDLANLRIVQLESAAEEHADEIATGALVRREDFEPTIVALRAELATAKHERETAHRKVREMEGEIENLTSTLFEQANTMVADARREHEAERRRNEQLRTQLRDNETLLASQNEQLQGLKDVVSRMGPPRDGDHHAAPPSPGADPGQHKAGSDNDEPESDETRVSHIQLVPEHPLNYTSLISLVSRSDIPSYADFVDLLKSNRPPLTHARSSSGDSSAVSSSIANTAKMMQAASTPSPMLPGTFTASSPRDVAFTIGPPLKDTRFFKRSLLEDIEPALRLDLAPGLSWLARRAVLTSVTSGTLVIEPYALSGKAYAPINACALCGEDGKDDVHLRRHRFRTSDDSGAQKYPLCDYCLERMRSTAGFIAFLRQARDGLWRSETVTETRHAWEQCIKLKEKMFWSRVGGGVVPVGQSRSHEQPEPREVSLLEPPASGDNAKESSRIGGDDESLEGDVNVHHATQSGS